MIKKALARKTKNITEAAYILAASSIFSALLGLFRDRLLAGRFGAGEELDIYYAAFRIPNLVFGLLISGGVIAAFLPVFSEYYSKNKKEAWRLTSNVLNVFLFFSILICALLAIFVPVFINLIVPGFNPQNKALTILLTRIIFLSPIFFGISNIFASVLQYFNRFFVYALAPIFYNLGIIFGILFLAPIFGLPGLAYGVILGAFFHWFVQVPTVIRCGFSWRPIFDLFSSGLRKIFRLMVPRTISALTSHFNLIIITAIASTLGAGNIAIFNFSEHLRSLPIGIVGGSFAVAAYPFLARSWANQRKEKFLKNFSLTFRQILFLIIPLSFSIFVLRAQIVRLILGTGKFGWLETQLTAASLGLFAIGIFAYALIPFIVRAFFSLQDTKTPLFVSIFSLSLNIGLSFLFVWLLKFPNFFSDSIASFLKLQGIENFSVVGLPLALTFSGIFQLLLLLVYLYRKVGDFYLKEIWSSFSRIVLVSLVMAICLWLTLHFMAGFVNMQKALGVLTQTAFASLVGVFVFGLLVYFLKFEELKFFKKLK
jgi:putative peptidoglycan lipid II flippase